MYQPTTSGLRVSKHKGGGQVRYSDVEATITSGYAHNIGDGDPVNIVAGVITVSDGTSFDAVFKGWSGILLDGTPYISANWVSGQAVSSIDTVDLFDDPSTEYAIVADGALASNPIGALANINMVAPITSNGISQCTLNVASIGTTGSAVRIVGVKGDPAAAFPELRVVNAKAAPATARQ